MVSDILLEKTKNILILVPGENARGGITNYYTSIRNDFPSNIIYLKRGSRNWPIKSNRFIEISRIISDYIKFIYFILLKNISLVQTTTSFSINSIIRDSFFIIIIKLFRKKVIVFFRGWNNEFVYNLSGLKLRLFKTVFFKADALIDLSQNKVNYLKKLGYKRPIFLETTLADINLIKDLKIEEAINRRYKSRIKTILYLSRIEKQKGIYKVLEIYISLKKINSNYRLVFAGDGSELNKLKDEIEKRGILDVSIMGFVQNENKRRLFDEASIFLFLSEFDGEGMPISVLEAMSFGLPVITTNVGGIASVIQDQRNGVLLKNYNKKSIVNKINQIVTNKKIYSSVSRNNYSDGKKLIWSNIVAKRMINIFNEMNSQN